jgi:hypothetical protein
METLHTEPHGILTLEQSAAIQGAIDGVADAHVALTLEQVGKIVELNRATPK